MTFITNHSNQATASSTFKPRRKVISGGVTGAFVTLIVITLNTYVLPAEKKIPADLSAAATTVLTFAVAYLVAPGSDETTTEEDGVIKSALKQVEN